MEWLWSAEPRRRVELALNVLAFAFVGLLAYEVVRRFVFPWDLWIWSESPFMTNMMKLSNGDSVFDGPAEANSWVYSPGLEYISFALLRPFGAHLDIRACRVIAIAVGLVGAAFTTKVASELLSVLREPGPSHRRFRIFGYAATTLLLFRSFTSDVCHADNLYIAHALVSLYLCVRAAKTASYRTGLLAVGVAALAPLAKQTGAFAFVGIASALFFLHRARWPLWRRLGLVALGGAVWCCATGLVLSSANSRYFLYEALSHHAVVWSDAVNLLRNGFSYPHRLVLVPLAIFAALRLIASRDERARVFLAGWAALVTSVAPAIGGFLKTGGGWNNLTIFDMWLAALALPVTWDVMTRAFEREEEVLEPKSERAEAGLQAGTLWAAVLALFIVALVPLKIPASPGQWAFGRTLDEAVRDDLNAGRKVLLPHGTMTLIRAGQKEVPIDRAGSVLEIRMGGGEPLLGIHARIERHHYDRIYLFMTEWYGPAILDAIERNYHEVRVLPGDSTYRLSDEYLSGQNGYMHAPVRVMAPN